MGESSGKKWYVLRVLSGREKKVKDYLENEINYEGWDHIITQILVPTEKVYKIRNGKKVIKERNMFPGYIYMEAEEKLLNGDIRAQIRNTTNVINFLGGNEPETLRDDEVKKLLGKVDEIEEMGEVANEPFLIDETVKIIDGPFNDFMGTIEEINEEKKKLKVIVKIFGRRTPVEVNFMQVEKVS